MCVWARHVTQYHSQMKIKLLPTSLSGLSLHMVYTQIIVDNVHVGGQQLTINFFIF